MRHEDILDSWKEVSNYLQKDIRTCRRWELEVGLPIHRIDKNSSHSKVFAYKSEIDQWLKKRANKKTFKHYIKINRWTSYGLIFVFVSFLSILVLNKEDILKLFPKPNQSTIAIFPFENVNIEDYELYFSEGVQGEIIRNISNLGKIKVIEVPSEKNNKEINNISSQIVKNPSVDYILQGKIEKSITGCTICVQFSRTKDSKIILDKKYDGRLDEILYIQKLICQEIHEKLGLNDNHISRQSSKEFRIQQYETYDNYLKGNFILNKFKDNNNEPWKLYHKGKYFLGGYTRESNNLAINFFTEAIRLDNNFILPYLGLAQCYLNYVNLNWDIDEKWLNKAEELLKRVQKNDINIPEYYSISIRTCLLKEICFNKNEEKNALELVEEGVQNYPFDAKLTAIAGSFYFMKYGKYGDQADFNKSLEYKDKSFWVAPHETDNVTYLELLMLKENFQKAIDLCNLMKLHNPSSLIEFRLGEILYYKGELDKCKDIFLEFFDASLELRIDSLFYLGMIAAQKGEHENAMKIIQEIELISPENHLLNEEVKLASIYFGLGIDDSGYQCLRSYFNKPLASKNQYIILRYLDIDENFRNVKNEKKFIKLIKNSTEDTNG